MIPLKDVNPTRTTPFMVYAIIIANILIYLYNGALYPHAQNPLAGYELIPYELVTGKNLGPPIPAGFWVTVFTAMFLHANLLHVGVNMLYLWIFGNNVEVAPASVITIPTATGRLSLKPTQDNYVYNVPGEDESFLKPHRAGELAEGWFSVNRESGQADIRVGVDYNKLLQLYFYNGTPNTFEWMYKKVKLNPGDKWLTGFSLTYN
jgi:hypothetical protein